MPPQKRPPCQICRTNESKYTCSKCMIVYCSVLCFKQHKESSCSSPPQANAEPSKSTQPLAPREQPVLFDSALPPSKADANAAYPTPHASYEPTARSEHAHPLEEEQGPGRAGKQLSEEEKPPKPPSPPLRPLTSLRWPYVPEESAYPDPLKRDDPKPLQLHQYEAIATSPAVRKALASHPQLPALLRSVDTLRGEDREEALQRALGVSAADQYAASKPGYVRSGQSEEEVKAFRQLAEAVEAAVRGGKEGALGLDWGD